MVGSCRRLGGAFALPFGFGLRRGCCGRILLRRIERNGVEEKAANHTACAGIEKGGYIEVADSAPKALVVVIPAVGFGARAMAACNLARNRQRNKAVPSNSALEAVMSRLKTMEVKKLSGVITARKWTLNCQLLM